MSSIYYGRFEGDDNPCINLRVPPGPRYARNVRDALTAFASLHGVRSHDLEAVLFAVGEAFANAIEHSKTREDIEVTVTVGDMQIIASVTDHGTGMRALPEGRAPLPTWFAERGRGIPIMQRCADLVEIRRPPGGGTTVVLSRLLREHPQETHQAV